MKLSKKLLSAVKLIKVKILKKRAPIIVSWILTYRCNRRCKYCDSWDIKSEELDTKEIFSLIRQMAQMGTQRLHLSGGEPLLKEDIGEIIAFCKKNKLSVDMNSNGALVAKKMEELNGLDLLSLSLDGYESIHDSIRGKGSYKEVNDAIEASKQRKLNLRLITVLSKVNLSAVDFILKRAAELKTPVIFQPARLRALTGRGVNPICPLPADYKKVIADLIIEKKKNNYIGNSIAGLNYLYNWPEPAKINCVNSFIACRLQPNGDMYGCGNLDIKDRAPNCVEVGFKQAFESLIPISCEECWCASWVELNNLFFLNMDTLSNIIKLSFK